jgi:hypothetical protein
MVNTASHSIPTKNHCRQIERSDFDAVIALLTRGFPIRAESHWRRALSRLETRVTPPDYPKYGYLLENEGAVVGVILLIFTGVEAGGEIGRRCYLSSWYVEPAFRSYASLLVSAAIRRREVTYVNVSPDPRTWPIIEAQGFSRYSKGQYRAMPLLSLRSETGRIREIRASDRVQKPIGALTAQILSDHAEYGCLSLVCEAQDGQYPFVFQVQRIARGVVPCAQLVYCRDVADLARFARPLGLFLLRRGIPFVSVDSNGKIEGLLGTYFEGKAPKYCKGHRPPRQGDLAYTEAVLFEP